MSELGQRIGFEMPTLKGQYDEKQQTLNELFMLKVEMEDNIKKARREYSSHLGKIEQELIKRELEAGTLKRIMTLAEKNSLLFLDDITGKYETAKNQIIAEQQQDKERQKMLRHYDKIENFPLDGNMVIDETLIKMNFEYEQLKKNCKKIYRELAKQLHPDTGSISMTFPEAAAELWEMAVTAYEVDDIVTLKLVNHRTISLLSDGEMKEFTDDEYTERIHSITLSINHLEEQLELLSKNQYHYVVQSPERIEARREELTEKIEQNNVQIFDMIRALEEITDFDFARWFRENIEKIEKGGDEECQMH